MKRLTALLLLAAMLLCGCSRISKPVNFYYVSKVYQNSLTDIIVSEERDASGHDGDLSYLLTLYLMGPADDTLQCLLPPGISIHTTQNQDGSLDIVIADTSRTLSDSDFSLACACLTLTCLEMTDATEINITSGSRSVTMDRNNLMLIDSMIEITLTEDKQ